MESLFLSQLERMKDRISKAEDYMTTGATDDCTFTSRLTIILQAKRVR